MSGGKIHMSDDLAEMSDDNGMMSGDMGAMSSDLAEMSDNIEAQPDDYAGMSWGSPLKSLNALALLRDLAAKLRYELSEWYWRKRGLSDPVLRKIHQETVFDDLFIVERVQVDKKEFSLYDERYVWLAEPDHSLMGFLAVEKAVRRRTRFLLAYILALAQKVLGRTARQRSWVLLRPFALQIGSGPVPLSPRPPPFACH
ncbi:MAG: hypothetical protein KDC00_11130 [Flavobacteriales bacterium]|nr:hypothetical protein [Flavobacteriales bacterium]